MQFQRPALAAEQRQRLSPQMIQSIKLMALPIQELKEQIQEEIEANPALEVLEDRSTISLESMPEAGDAGSERDEFFENSSDPGFASRSSSDDDSKRMFLEGAISRAETLQEHLLWQLRIQRLSQKQREMGEAIIQNLDDDGFYKEDPKALFPKSEADNVAAVISLIQGFEPAGTCTANFRESLLVQALLDPEAPPIVITILKDHIDLLEKGRHSEIQKRLKLDEEELKRALAFIKELSPFPGRAYSTEEPRYVIPDLLVKLKEGDFVIILNDEEIPVLGIDPFFDRLAGEKKGDRATASYVKDNIRRAKFFIRSIHQRNQTLLKVARAVVECQRPFFIDGPKHLAPLTLRDVAQEIGVHETTVSRIAHSKYMQTDWGIFEFRYFFSNSISGAGSAGSRYSKEGVKQIIKEIIQNEESSLSDRDIVDALARRGIPLARRTVAKYRQELDLDSSFGRKRNA
ncbi:MAG TPA: RNA polymerase factor sigma-54 [Rectinemataceae bacterium]|nr:RNA polymerase factor sigma-54 [Rectinemataceae bacterium]